MKKCFLLVFAIILLLTACSEGTTKQETTVDELNSQLEELRKQIATLSDENNELKNELEALKQNKTIDTNDFEHSNFPLLQDWIETESDTSERDAYETIISAFYHIDDEISRGWVDEGFIDFLKVLKGDVVSEKLTTNELINLYNSLDSHIGNSTYSVRDFFCVNSYGDSTNTGIYNFFETIDQLESQKFSGKDVVSIRNGSIVSWDFSIAGGDDKVAEALGISPELIQIILHAAVDAGFNISFN